METHEEASPQDRKPREIPISKLAQEIASRALKRREEEFPNAALSPTGTAHDPVQDRTPTRPRRASRALSRFLIAVGMGIAATLAWQSYGGSAKQMIAGFAQEQLGLPISLSSSIDPAAGERSSSPVVQPSTAPNTLANNTPDAPQTSIDMQQLQSIARDLALVRSGLDRLAARQEEMARKIVSLESAEQEVRDKLMTLVAKPVVTPARNPAQNARPTPSAQRMSPLSAAPVASPATVPGSRP